MLHRFRQGGSGTRGSRKVADEAMFGEAEGAGQAVLAHQINRGRPALRFLAVVYSVIRVPISALTCFSMKEGSGADRMWVTGETVRVSEIDHLMVRDSMRYAILM